jgi:hypothetical protein
MGLAFGVAGLVRLVVLSWLRSSGTSTTGRVVRLERWSRYTWTEGQTPYTPVAEFEANGQRYDAKGASSFPPLYGVGDSVQVCYPPDRPDRGQVVAGWELAGAWLCLAFGAVFGFFALAIARLGDTI